MAVGPGVLRRIPSTITLIITVIMLVRLVWAPKPSVDSDCLYFIVVGWNGRLVILRE